MVSGARSCWPPRRVVNVEFLAIVHDLALPQLVSILHTHGEIAHVGCGVVGAILVFGPTASRKMSPTCSSFRIRWWRDWPTLWVSN